jgi:transposase
MDYAFILSLDVASKKLDLCWNEKEELNFQSIGYTEENLENFLSEHPFITSDNCLVGMESTGSYHLLAERYFLEKGFTVKIINPIITKQFINATIRKSKTDKKDSEVIYKLLLAGEGDEADISRLMDTDKELLRLSSTLTKCATQLKLRLQNTRRKNLDNTEAVENKMEKLIKEIEKLSNEAVDQATEDRSREEELIDSIPGFAVKLSAVVYHELGDISRFNNTKALVAYAGLDPKIKQSGQNLNTTGRITKRGSSSLRAALYLAANVARNFDSVLGEYYAKKKSEGRSHKEILVMISRKLLYRIHAVLKNNREHVKC